MPVLARVETRETSRGRWPRLACARVLVVLLIAFTLIGMVAPRAAAEANHSLEVTVSFPDNGLVDKEQLCLGLFPKGTRDFSKPPMQARCMDPGQSAVTFEEIDAASYVIAVPAVGSRLEQERYQGQLVQTTIPDEPTLDAYGIEVTLNFASGFDSTTGQVHVNVFGCPPGTNGGGDATVWASECHAVANGIPLSLSGLGTIRDTSIEGVTGAANADSGKVEFTNLPAGAYQLGGKLPGNVDSPAVFIQSSIEGGVHPVANDQALAIRPSELVAVDVYLVLDDNGKAAANPTDTSREIILAGVSNPPVTGGLTEAETKAMHDAANAATPVPAK